MHHNNRNLIRPRRVKVRSNLRDGEADGEGNGREADADAHKSRCIAQRPVYEKRGDDSSFLPSNRCNLDLRTDRTSEPPATDAFEERYIDLTAPRDPRRSLPLLHFYYRSDLLTQSASDTHHSQIDSCCCGGGSDSSGALPAIFINSARSHCHEYSHTCAATPDSPTLESFRYSKSRSNSSPHGHLPVAQRSDSHAIAYPPLCDKHAMSLRTLEASSGTCPLACNSARRGSKFAARCSRLAPVVAVWDCGGSTAPASTPTPFDGPFSNRCSGHASATGELGGCTTPVGQGPMGRFPQGPAVRSCPMSPASTASPSPLSTPVSALPPGTDSEGSSPPGPEGHLGSHTNSFSSLSRVHCSSSGTARSTQSSRPHSLQTEVFFSSSSRSGGRGGNVLTPDALSALGGRLVHTPEQRNCSPLVRHDRADSTGRGEQRGAQRAEQQSADALHKSALAAPQHQSRSARVSDSEFHFEDGAALANSEAPSGGGSSSSRKATGRRPQQQQPGNSERVIRSSPKSPAGRKKRSSSGTPSLRLQAISDSHPATDCELDDSDGGIDDALFVGDGFETRPSSALESDGHNAVESDDEKQLSARGLPARPASAQEHRTHNSAPQEKPASPVESNSKASRLPPRSLELSAPVSASVSNRKSVSPAPGESAAHCVSPVSPCRRPSRLIGLLPNRSPLMCPSGLTSTKLPPAAVRRAQQLGLDSCCSGGAGGVVQNARSVPDVSSAVSGGLATPRGTRAAAHRGALRQGAKQHPFARLGDKLGLRGALPYIELYLVTPPHRSCAPSHGTHTQPPAPTLSFTLLTARTKSRLVLSPHDSSAIACTQWPDSFTHFHRLLSDSHSYGRGHTQPGKEQLASARDGRNCSDSAGRHSCRAASLECQWMNFRRNSLTSAVQTFQANCLPVPCGTSGRDGATRAVSVPAKVRGHNSRAHSSASAFSNATALRRGLPFAELKSLICLVDVK